MREDKSRNFRKAKAVALKNILAPAGFVKGKRLFVRHAGNQIHGIEFQTSTWGGVYFINVGFHYDFIPSAPKLFTGGSSNWQQCYTVAMGGLMNISS